MAFRPVLALAASAALLTVVVAVTIILLWNGMAQNRTDTLIEEFKKVQDELAQFFTEKTASPNDLLSRIPTICGHYLDQADELLAENRTVSGIERLQLNILKFQAELCLRSHKAKSYVFPALSSLVAMPLNVLERCLGDGWTQEPPASNGSSGIASFRRSICLESQIWYWDRIPHMFNVSIAMLRLGIAERLTFANETVAETIQLLDQYLDSAPARLEQLDKLWFGDPIQGGVKDPKISKAVEQFAKVTNLAVRGLNLFLKGEYSKHVRPGPGLGSASASRSNGEHFYQLCLDFHTGIPGFTARDLHDIGLAEVAKLRREMSGVLQSLGRGQRRRRRREELQEHDAISNVVFELMADSDHRMHQQGLIEYGQNLLSERVNPALDRVFPARILDQAVYQVSVKPSPTYSLNLLAYYSNQTFYLDTSNIMPYEVMAILLHETNPGHHLQQEVSRKQSLTSRWWLAGLGFWEPGFVPESSSYVEGWGLYSETLGKELGLFNRTEDMVGYLSYQLLRACRLVVDTGIHAYGWSVEQAVDYLVTNTALSRPVCEMEVARYVTLPGQATSYMVGQSKILELRAKQRSLLGDAFDLKEFHSQVLSCEVPLAFLEECLLLAAADQNRYHNEAGSNASPSLSLQVGLIFPWIIVIFCSLIKLNQVVCLSLRRGGESLS